MRFTLRIYSFWSILIYWVASRLTDSSQVEFWYKVKSVFFIANPLKISQPIWEQKPVDTKEHQCFSLFLFLFFFFFHIKESSTLRKIQQLTKIYAVWGVNCFSSPSFVGNHYCIVLSDLCMELKFWLLENFST